MENHLEVERKVEVVGNEDHTMTKCCGQCSQVRSTNKYSDWYQGLTCPFPLPQQAQAEYQKARYQQAEGVRRLPRMLSTCTRLEAQEESDCAPKDAYSSNPVKVQE